MAVSALRFWPLAIVLVPLLTLFSLYMALLADSRSGFRPAARPDAAPGVPAAVTDARGPLATLVQISDVHIVPHDEGERGHDLAKTLQALQALVKPQMILISGDLTDAESGETDEKEWEIYRESFESAGFDAPEINEDAPPVDYFVSRADAPPDGGVLFDIRGNHDVVGIIVDGDFYAKHGFRRHAAPVYAVDLVADDPDSAEAGPTLRVVVMDTTPAGGSEDGGPSAGLPLNVFGRLRGEQREKVSEWITAAGADDQVPSAVLLAGHYPFSQLASGPELSEDVTAFLCGHAHVPDYYVRKENGVLELELDDFKDDRVVRLMAYDHGVLAVRDVEASWPRAMLTFPKDPLFVFPTDVQPKEPPTHFRALLFSQGGNRVELSIKGDDDDDYVDVCTMTQSAADERLYTCPRPADVPENGMIRLQVFDGLESSSVVDTVEHSFSADNSSARLPRGLWAFFGSIKLPVFSRTILNLAVVLGSLYQLILPPILVAKGYVPRVAPAVTAIDSKRSALLHPLLSAMTFYNNISMRLRILLLVINANLLVGILIFGPLIRGHWGALFAFGLRVSGSSETYSPPERPLGLFIMYRWIYFHLVRLAARTEPFSKWTWLLCTFNLLGFIFMFVVTAASFSAVALIFCPALTWIFPLFLVLVYRRSRIKAKEKVDEEQTTEMNSVVVDPSASASTGDESSELVTESAPSNGSTETSSS